MRIRLFLPSFAAALLLAASGGSAEDGAASTSDHWSFQPVPSPPLPVVADLHWVRDDLDRFILARLERAGLAPNPDADRYTLLRRVALDLTGLPPSEGEIHDFVSDAAATDEALARVVDRYLASDRFGERWARHWLDVVRYADSVGRNWNAPFTYAWRYRDYVIDAFNADKAVRSLRDRTAGGRPVAAGRHTGSGAVPLGRAGPGADDQR